MTLFDINSAVPRHVQLKELTRNQILAGQMAVHSQLLSEREYCERYQISRTTVRRAMADLLGEGLVYTTVGKGTFVAAPPIKEEIQPLSSFTEDMARRGIKSTSRMLKAIVQNANDEQANHLRVPRGAEVVVLHRLRLADDLPVAIQMNMIPHHLCPDLLRYDLAARSLYDILRNKYRLKLTYADTGIRASLAGAEECRLLKLTNPAALLISDQTTYLVNGDVIEFTNTYFRGDKYTLFTRFGYAEQRGENLTSARLT